MSKAQFIRGFWGDINSFSGKYKDQISKSFTLKDELTYVYGSTNNYFIEEKFKRTTTVVSAYEYDYRLAVNHTLFDHKSLLHKLKIIQLAMNDFDEVIYLDWDMEQVKEVDDTFYKTFEGFDLQVPLYCYPIDELDKLVESDDNRRYYLFFTKLKNYLKQHAWIRNDSYVIPNTGFFYCNDKKIIDELFKIAKSRQLQTVPDELSVLFYAKELGLDIDGYINHFEPTVISGKDCGSESWNQKGKLLEEFIEEVKQAPKDVYFKHV